METESLKYEILDLLTLDDESLETIRSTLPEKISVETLYGTLHELFSSGFICLHGNIGFPDLKTFLNEISIHPECSDYWFVLTDKGRSYYETLLMKYEKP